MRIKILIAVFGVFLAIGTAEFYIIKSQKAKIKSLESINAGLTAQLRLKYKELKILGENCDKKEQIEQDIQKAKEKILANDYDFTADNKVTQKPQTYAISQSLKQAGDIIIKGLKDE